MQFWYQIATLNRSKNKPARRNANFGFPRPPESRFMYDPANVVTLIALRGLITGDILRAEN